MKKQLIRCVCALMGAIFMLFSFSACSSELYDYDLDHYITVPKEWAKITVTEEEIIAKRNALVSEVLKNTASQEDKFGSGAGDGDRVRVSFTFYVFDHTKGEYVGNTTFSDSDCLIELGGGKYPRELENAIRGKRAGDVFEALALLKPDFSYPSLQGRTVKYVGTVLNVTGAVTVSLTDELVQSISRYETAAEYEQMLYVEAKRELYWSKLLAAVSVEAYPQEEVDKYTSDYTNYYSELATAAEVTLEEYVAKKFFIELREFHVQADVYAKELVKNEMVLYWLTRKYDLELTNSEYNDGAYKYALDYGLDSVAKLEGRFGSDIVEQTVLMDKVKDFVVSEAEKATATENVQ